MRTRWNRRTWLLAGAATTSARAGECIYIPPEGVLEIIAVDILGGRIENLEIVLDSPTFGRRERITNGSKLPYGHHRLEVRAGGFAARGVMAHVFEPFVTIRVVLNIGSIGCPRHPAAISGRITGLTPETENWIKAVPLRGTDSFEAPVTSTGRFLLSGLDHTQYILLVIQGSTVVHQQTFDTFPVRDGAFSLSINLPHA